MPEKSDDEERLLQRFGEGAILRAAGRITAGRRTSNNGGRPRSTTAPRCPCGANTLRRAARLCMRCCREAKIAPELLASARESARILTPRG